MTTATSALIDSHCHLHFPPLGDDIPALLAAMREHGVHSALAVATDRSEMETVRQLAAAHPQHIHAACGIHPTTDDTIDLAALIHACAPQTVIAVGETGLDHFHQPINRERQRANFTTHIEAARRLCKPLIIHTRESLTATLDILKAERADDIGGVMHCYTGDKESARRALDLNFYLSFSGIISFKNAAALREVAAWVPADRYLVETDSPYLAPVPYRGKTNTPGYVRHVARAVAAARGETETVVAIETTANFQRLFNIRERPAAREREAHPPESAHGPNRQPSPK